MSLWDTRLPVIMQDTKCGTACYDDARCRLADILDNGSLAGLAERDRVDLERARDEYNKLIERADALLGLMSRLDDRLAPIEEKQL